MPNRGELASVNTFFKRVVKAFALVLFIGTMVLVFLVYRPMSKELEKSLLSNYAQVADMNSHTLEHVIHSGLDGARDLSSRSMIKLELLYYLDGKLSLDELRTHIGPIYRETVKSLENLECARRLVDGVEIAHYKAINSDECVAVITEDFEIDYSKEQRLLSTSCNIYSIVVTPVISDNRIIAYDELIFNLSESVEKLNRGNIETYLMEKDDYSELKASSPIVYQDEDTEIFKVPNCLLSVNKLDEEIYLATCQDQDLIMAPIGIIKVRVLAIGIAVILGFMAVIYIYLVMYARREFESFEMEKFSLKKIAEEVNVDSLTNAGSRNSGQKYLKASFDDFRAKKKSSALILIDIKNFKKINDTYGHNCGDRVLIEFVDRVLKIIRSEDKLFRWGGDEFVGVFYHIDHNGIDRVVQKIFRAIDREAFILEDGKTQVTISVGISFFKEEDEGYEGALKRADQAMYAAKKQKGNAASVLL